MSLVSNTFDKRVSTLSLNEHWSMSVRLEEIVEQFATSADIQFIHYIRHRGWQVNDTASTWQDGPSFIVNRHMDVFYFEPAGSQSHAQSTLDFGSLAQDALPHLTKVLASQDPLTLNVATLALSQYLRDMIPVSYSTHWVCQERALTNAQAAFFALLRLGAFHNPNPIPCQLYLSQNFDAHWKRYLQNLGFALYTIGQIPYDSPSLRIEELPDMFHPIFAEFCDPHGKAILQVLQQRTPLVPEILFSRL